MCTASWQKTAEGFELFFNRDELKTRSRAEPPRELIAENGTRYLAPIDPDGGGTWLFANEHGLGAGLLNRWHLEDKLGHRSLGEGGSRGQLLLELASLPEIPADLSSLAKGNKPFDLISFKNGQVQGFGWDGHELTPFSPSCPITSSSFQFNEVQAARLSAFSETNSLAHFQTGSGQSPTAYTVRMNRPDAQTWSRSHLRITSEGIEWDYWEEFPDLEQPAKLWQSCMEW